MHMFTTGSVKKKLLSIATVTLTLGLLTVGGLLLARPATSHAAPSCPQDKHPETNIAYCGLDGSSVTAAINSVKNYYNNNSDASGSSSQPANMVHTDIRAVLTDPNWGHASGSMIAGMNSSNTKLGTSMSNGNIVVDGQVVGKDMWIAARWNSTCSTPFKKVEGDVFVHSFTCFFNDTFPNGVPTLVHFDSAGTADFAVWVPCMNVLTFTAVPPVHSLTCDSLDATPGDFNSDHTTFSYTFVAHATGNNAPITRYDFDFGDHTSQQVSTSRGFTPPITHPYNVTDLDQNLTATVTVNASGVTPKSCTAPVHIPAKPVTTVSSLQCSSLQANPQPGTNDTFTFTATALPTHTTIDFYTFNFNNGSSQKVNTTESSATSEAVKFASGTTAVTASVTGPLGTFTDNCKTSVTVPAVLAAATTALPNTGAGSALGIAGLMTVAGGLFHRFVLRRKFLS